MQYYVLNEDTAEKCFWRAESNLQRLATQAGKNLKSFVVFDTCREPIEIPRSKVIEFHRQKAAKEAGEAYIEGEEVKDLEKSNEVSKPKSSNSPFNYYAIYGTTGGSTVKADS